MPGFVSVLATWVRISLPIWTISRALAIIAMVPKIRKEEDGYAVVYGCHSDSYNFSFFRIEDESRVRLPPTHDRLIHTNEVIGALPDF